MKNLTNTTRALAVALALAAPAGATATTVSEESQQCIGDEETTYLHHTRCRQRPELRRTADQIPHPPDPPSHRLPRGRETVRTVGEWTRARSPNTLRPRISRGRILDALVRRGCHSAHPQGRH